jgi:hypothetical protein
VCVVCLLSQASDLSEQTTVSVHFPSPPKPDGRMLRRGQYGCGSTHTPTHGCYSTVSGAGRADSWPGHCLAASLESGARHRTCICCVWRWAVGSRIASADALVCLRHTLRLLSKMPRRRAEQSRCFSGLSDRRHSMRRSGRPGRVWRSCELHIGGPGRARVHRVRLQPSLTWTQTSYPSANPTWRRGRISHSGPLAAETRASRAPDRARVTDRQLPPPPLPPAALGYGPRWTRSVGPGRENES